MKKFMIILIASAMVISFGSCSGRTENSSENSSESSLQSGEVSQQNSEENSKESSETSSKPLPHGEKIYSDTDEEHDEAWWWENYIADIVYDFQEEYPTQSDALNQKKELLNLLVYAKRTEQAEVIADNKESPNILITKETADRLAPEALGKPDISHLYTDACIDENGKIGLYVSSVYREHIPDAEGDWAFSVMGVDYKDDGIVDVRVENDTFKRVFTYKANDAGTYTLLGVSEALAAETHSAEMKINVPYKLYESLGRMFENMETMGICGDKLVKISDNSEMGLEEFLLYDINDMKKAPVKFMVKLDRGEKISTTYINSRNNIVVTTDKRMMELSPEDGKIIKEKPVTETFREAYSKYDSEYGVNYVCDDDFNYIAYTTPDGLYAENVNTSESVKVCDVTISHVFIDSYPVEIKDGILRFVNENLTSSLDKDRYFDIDKKEEVPPEIFVPHAENAGIIYEKIIGNKVIGIPDAYSECDYAMEILDLDTEKSVTVPAEYSGPVVYNGDEVYLITNEDAENYDTHNMVRKVDLETGKLSEPIMEIDCMMLKMISDSEKMVAEYHGDYGQDVASGIIVME